MMDREYVWESSSPCSTSSFVVADQAGSLTLITPIMPCIPWCLQRYWYLPTGGELMSEYFPWRNFDRIQTNRRMRPRCASCVPCLPNSRSCQSRSSPTSDRTGRRPCDLERAAIHWRLRRRWRSAASGDISIPSIELGVPMAVIEVVAVRSEAHPGNRHTDRPAVHRRTRASSSFHSPCGARYGSGPSKRRGCFPRWQGRTVRLARSRSCLWSTARPRERHSHPWRSPQRNDRVCERDAGSPRHGSTGRGCARRWRYRSAESLRAYVH